MLPSLVSAAAYSRKLAERPALRAALRLFKDCLFVVKHDDRGVGVYSPTVSLMTLIDRPPIDQAQCRAQSGLSCRKTRSDTLAVSQA